MLTRLLDKLARLVPVRPAPGPITTDPVDRDTDVALAALLLGVPEPDAMTPIYRECLADEAQWNQETTR